MTSQALADLKPLAITMGDAAGIGPEIIAKAYRDDPMAMQGCFVVGDVATLRRAARVVAPAGCLPLPVACITEAIDALPVPPHCIPVLQPRADLGLIPWGQVSGAAGAFAGDCVVWAARAALNGSVSAMVTAPLHKEALHAAGLPFSAFPGHTELLQSEAARHLGVSVAQLPVRMMLANSELRTVLVSIHMSLRDAIAAVTFANIVETIQITHDALSRLLGRAPRIAVAGLNPHAGEGGLFGRDEIELIQPAIEAARQKGQDVSGPYAPDTIFMRARQKSSGEREFDVVIAMYHDQGLIPVKYLGVEDGVNVTLGLPLVRTSPDHGTAFDIAGSGRADPRSLLQAIRMARALN
ncbi:MAG: 4-hydroxythreonine-4-phosphate dehydrogenase PdxA [Burkholderiales bacterium PBB3]|nr:MAG: 4-hydroxythreonine-4-phosphate dehydrogenase PdxA [Burkholderiales bacterium PBB3]